MKPTENSSDHVYRELDCVVLLRDLPGAGLRAGEVGTAVCVYGCDALEVEFVGDTGEIRALCTIPVADVRPAGAQDLNHQVVGHLRAEEAARRLAELRSGAVAGVPAADVFARVARRLGA